MNPTKKKGGRPLAAFSLAEIDLVEIEGILRDGRVEVRSARRARVLCLRAQGVGPTEIAQLVSLDPATVWRICERYEQGGLGEALLDAPRPGRPRSFPP